VTATAWFILLFIIAGWIVAALNRRLRASARESGLEGFRLRSLAVSVLLGALVLAGVFVLLMPGGLLFDNVALRPAFTAIATIIAVLSLALLLKTIRLWRQQGVSVFSRMQAGVLSAVAIALAVTAT